MYWSDVILYNTRDNVKKINYMYTKQYIVNKLLNATYEINDGDYCDYIYIM